MPQTLGKKIELARREMNLSQGQLAEATGIARPTLSLYESGKIKTIGPDNLLKIAQATGKPLSFFTEQKGGGPVLDDLDAEFLCSYQKLLSILAKKDKTTIQALIALLQ